MKKKIIIIIILFVIITAIAAYFRSKNNNGSGIQPSPVSPEISTEQNKIPAENKNANFLPPLDRAKERVTKKYFGLFVTPQNSPVQPEKFFGYHTGTDFEIFSGEENIEVPVKAVCNGNILIKKSATGYGGVAVESCALNNEPIAVIYGHLKLSSINYNAGDKINAGDTIGILGAPYSAETSGERKHLHLGFHKGSSINILGYVQNQAELSGWLDPCLYVCAP